MRMQGFSTMQRMERSFRDFLNGLDMRAVFLHRKDIARQLRGLAVFDLADAMEALTERHMDVHVLHSLFRRFGRQPSYSLTRVDDAELVLSPDELSSCEAFFAVREAEGLFPVSLRESDIVLSADLRLPSGRAENIVHVKLIGCEYQKELGATLFSIMCSLETPDFVRSGDVSLHIAAYAGQQYLAEMDIPLHIERSKPSERKPMMQQDEDFLEYGHVNPPMLLPELPVEQVEPTYEKWGRIRIDFKAAGTRKNPNLLLSNDAFEVLRVKPSHAILRFVPNRESVLRARLGDATGQNVKPVDKALVWVMWRNQTLCYLAEHEGSGRE